MKRLYQLKFAIPLLLLFIAPVFFRSSAVECPGITAGWSGPCQIGGVGMCQVGGCAATERCTDFNTTWTADEVSQCNLDGWGVVWCAPDPTCSATVDECTNVGSCGAAAGVAPNTCPANSDLTVYVCGQSGAGGQKKCVATSTDTLCPSGNCAAGIDRASCYIPNVCTNEKFCGAAANSCPPSDGTTIYACESNGVRNFCRPHAVGDLVSNGYPISGYDDSCLYINDCRVNNTCVSPQVCDTSTGNCKEPVAADCNPTNKCSYGVNNICTSPADCTSNICALDRDPKVNTKHCMCAPADSFIPTGTTAADVCCSGIAKAPGNVCAPMDPTTCVANDTAVCNPAAGSPPCCNAPAYKCLKDTNSANYYCKKDTVISTSCKASTVECGFTSECCGGLTCARGGDNILRCGNYKALGVTGLNLPRIDSFDGLVSTIYIILLPVALGIGMFFIAKAGYRIKTSQGNPQEVADATDELFHAVIGTGVVSSSMVILRIVINALIGRL